MSRTRLVVCRKLLWCSSWRRALASLEPSAAPTTWRSTSRRRRRQDRATVTGKAARSAPRTIRLGSKGKP